MYSEVLCLYCLFYIITLFRKKWYQCIHWWVLVGATALLLSVLFVSLIIIWDKIEEEKRDVEELDYVLFGPDKDTSG